MAAKNQPKMWKKQRFSVILAGQDLSSHPNCPHGPTLLFESGGRRYFACSAYRDSKDCRFHHPAEEEFLEKHRKKWKMETDRVLPTVDLAGLQDRCKAVLGCHPLERLYCHTCSLLLESKDAQGHAKHQVRTPVSTHLLDHPSELLIPKEGNKKEAQFFFSESATAMLVNNFKNLGITHVLCVGTPRVHEFIRNEHKSICSMLLDIDWRYHGFYGPTEFCWYNMFNHHFFLGAQSEEEFNSFIRKGKKNLAVVLDPPFGGRVEVLKFVLGLIESDWKSVTGLPQDSKLATFWAFPYFMEPQFKSHLPHFTMLDYKVNYENHDAYQTGLKGRIHGSPVRIFTNVDPGKICLPEDEGYKYCDTCEIWVSSENNHCFKCGRCTSKDGRPYVHCDLCNKCVKSSWSHCNSCGRCCLFDHPCQEFQSVGIALTGSERRGNSPMKRKGPKNNSKNPTTVSKKRKRKYCK